MIEQWVWCFLNLFPCRPRAETQGNGETGGAGPAACNPGQGRAEWGTPEPAASLSSVNR